VDWRLVFYINVPFALMALPAIWFNLPNRRGGRRPKIDFLGAGFLSVASVLTLLALVWAGDRYAWASPEIIGLFCAAAVLVVIFIRQESRHPEPMLPLHLFRNGVFVLSNMIVFTLGVGMFGVIAYLPTFVQTALGASATASGIITTPQSLGVLVTSVLGGQIIARTGRYRWVAIVGSAIIISGMVFLSRLTINTPELSISAIMVVLGFGFGLVMPTMSLVVQNAVPYEYLGVATSSSQFFRQIGTVLGTAVFGALLASSYQSAFQSKLPQADRDAFPPAVVQEFKDPTLALDKVHFAQVQDEVRKASPSDGERLLNSALHAQKLAIASANRTIFTLALVVAIISGILAIFMKELPLRRNFKPVEEGASPAPGAEPAELVPEIP
jgi:predicted MFS family arabinose efflux permease